MISENGPRVIDWEIAGHGKPLMDEARTALILSIGEFPRPTSISMQDQNGIRRALISAYLGQYFGRQHKTNTQSRVAWDLAAAVVRFDEKIALEERQLEQIIEK